MTRNNNKKNVRPVPQPKGRKQPNTKMTTSSNVTSRALVLRAQPSATLKGGRQQQKLQSPNALPKFLIAQVDPFCPQAMGVKVPDEANMPSATAFSRDLQTFTTGAAGGQGFVFRYNSGSAIVPTVPATSTTWSYIAAFGGVATVSNNAALVQNFQLIRTVAFGIKIETRQSAFNASGFVHVALVPDDLFGTTYTYPTSVSQMEYAPYYRRIPIADLIEDEITVNGKYTDNTAFRYNTPGVGDVGAIGYTGSFPASGWSAILVWIEVGGAITNAIDVEFIHHYEALVQNNGTGGVIEITAAAPTSPGLMAATTFVTEHVEPIQVNREDEENNGNYWAVAGKLFKVGLKVASGVFPILAPIQTMFDAMAL